MEQLLADIPRYLLQYAGELILSIVLILVGRKWRRRLVREVRDEVVARLRDEYVRLDYPNAKPISDIHSRLNDVTKILKKMKPSEGEDNESETH